jgi:hypothetical protein
MADRVLRMSSGRLAAVEVNQRKLSPEDLVW